MKDWAHTELADLVDFLNRSFEDRTVFKKQTVLVNKIHEKDCN